jgi:hypothetical protein
LPNRILKESICTSENIDNLTPEEEVFFYRLMVNCDDYGRIDARPAILRARCYPLRLEKIKEKDITKWLDALAKQNLIILYQLEEHTYLQITKWKKHQQIRASKSKYPGPDDEGALMISSDINCNQQISSDINCNQQISSDINGNQSKSNVPVIEIEYDNRNRISEQNEFELFWKHYPKKVGKMQAFKNWKKLIAKGYTNEQLIQCANNYKALVLKEKRESKFIKHAEGFLNPDKMMFADYLESEKEEDFKIPYIPVDEQLKEYL